MEAFMIAVLMLASYGAMFWIGAVWERARKENVIDIAPPLDKRRP